MHCSWMIYLFLHPVIIEYIFYYLFRFSIICLFKWRTDLLEDHVFGPLGFSQQELANKTQCNALFYPHVSCMFWSDREPIPG